MIESYTAVAVQTIIRHVKEPKWRDAVIVGNDVNFFELTRVFAFRGAEIFLHPTREENGSEFPAWDQARRSRGYEGLCYLASANSGEIKSACYPSLASRGCSTVVDFQGNIAASIDGPGESFLTTRIDLQRLRSRRMQGRMNYPAQVKSALFGKEFGKQVLMPINTGPATAETGAATIQRLQDENIMVKP
jgi:predicted amidohydrolase